MSKLNITERAKKKAHDFIDNEKPFRLGLLMKSRVLLSIVLIAVSCASAQADDLRAAIAAKHPILVADEWGGGRRTIFDFGGRRAWVVEPPAGTPCAEGRPWVWTMQWMGAYLDRTGAPDLVRRGFCHVHLEAFDTRANEEGLRALAAFQECLVGELGFAPKANLIGMSWGGFYAVRYAAAYPQNVARIYLDAPLLTFHDFPRGATPDATARKLGPWEAVRPPDGNWMDDPRMPVNLAAALAKANIPVYLLYGGQDQTVDPKVNCKLFASRFKAAGGAITVEGRPLYGHHPHGFEAADIPRIVAFFDVGTKVREPSPTTLIAHRGESVDAPENTLPAYRTAVERGFGFECDIYLSKDNRLFTFHDRDLTRTTAGANTNRCIDVDWEGTVSKLNVGGWGKWKGSAFDPTRPALFSEVLALARDGRRIYVEVKDDNPAWVPYVKAEIERAPNVNPGNVLFISFGEHVLAELKRQMPAYRAYFLMGTYKKWGDASCPWSADEVLAKLRATGADGIDIRFEPTVHDAAFVGKIKSAGYSFHVWTIDELEKAKAAFAVGADTLTTNCAKAILEGYELEGEK